MEDEAPITTSWYRWIILFLVWLVYFSFGLILTSIPPLVTPIAADLSLTYSQMGVILGSVILMYVPLAIPIGVIIDRVGQKRMITAGVLFTSMSAILRAFAFSFETLFLTVFLFGFGGPTISVGLAKVVASFFEGRERGIASGIYMTGAIVGSAAALAITNSLILPLVGTWRNVFVVYGVIGLLIAVTWLLLGREPVWSGDEGERFLPLRAMAAKLLGHKQVWMVAIVGSSSFLVFYGFSNWLPTLLELRGLSPVDAGILSSLPSWIGLVGSAAIPGLAEAGSRKPVIVIVLLLEGISMVIAGLAYGPLLIVSLVVYGVTSGASMPLLLVVLMDMQDVGAEYTGIASGIFFSIGAFCGFLGPIIVGYLTDLTGSFIPAVVTLALVVEAMIALTLALKEA
ncbi:MAG: MFS transporter [Candidatus Thorarchaeota archaeon]|jgi:cyanate permease